MSKGRGRNVASILLYVLRCHMKSPESARQERSVWILLDDIAVPFFSCSLLVRSSVSFFFLHDPQSFMRFSLKAPAW